MASTMLKNAAFIVCGPLQLVTHRVYVRKLTWCFTGVYIKKQILTIEYMKVHIFELQRMI